LRVALLVYNLKIICFLIAAECLLDRTADEALLAFDAIYSSVYDLGL
jgi:hypothetical protein